MFRKYYIVIAILLLIAIAFNLPPHHHLTLWWMIPAIVFIIVGLYDCFSKHNVLRNYPVIGHLRYMFEFIRPEIQQYFVATDVSGRPFNRESRSLVYRRAKNVRDTHPFGTEHDIQDTHYEFSQHSINPGKMSYEDLRISFGNEQCTKPYHGSRLNISAMSFGALSSRAIRSLNSGAKQGNFAHNTGEGGLTPHHLREGGDLIWQIGTAYFGTRTPDGNFDPQQFATKAQNPVVKMIEIKISQGAKPGHGGVLPAKKITKEIAAIRGIPMGKDCVSPASHSAFNTPIGLLEFVKQLRDLSGGKPVGFKLCIGIRSQFMSICKAMLKTDIYPDFITIDGAEGGTGAAPVEFTNRLGTPINEGLAFAHNCLVGCNIRQHVKLIASGKVISGFDMAMKLALGADACNMARPMMFAIGCIQSLHCDTDKCPTGVATTDKRRSRAIVVKDKAKRVKNFQHATLMSFKSLVEAMGIHHPDHLTPCHIKYRVNEAESVTFEELFKYLTPGALLGDNIPPTYATDWAKAAAEHF